MSDERPTPLYPEPLPSKYGGIRSQPPTPAYHEAWERIFGKKKRPKPRPRPKPCGRRSRRGG